MIIIRDVKIESVVGEDVESCNIVIDNGKIVDITKELPTSDGEIIDGMGLVAYPGLIDAHTHIGICEEIYQYEGEDTNEMTDPLTPELRVVDGVNPRDMAFYDAVRGGVTTVCVMPGSANIFGGTGVVMKTHGEIMDKMTIDDKVAMKGALGENPKRVYGDQKKKPMTRMANAAIFREHLVKAQNYLKKHEETDLHYEDSSKLVAGKLKLHLHAHRADDIVTGIRLAKEFDLDMVLIHGTEGYTIPDYIKESGYPLLVGPLLMNRCKPEIAQKSYIAPGVLDSYNVDFAIITDHPVVPIEHLPLTVALAHKEGLSRLSALRAMTINPAKILGIADRVGSIEVGKDADIILVDGDILSLDGKVKLTIIDGEIVYDNRQK